MDIETICIVKQIITTILLIAMILTVSPARALKMSLDALPIGAGELILGTALLLPAQILILICTIWAVLVSVTGPVLMNAEVLVSAHKLILFTSVCYVRRRGSGTVFLIFPVWTI